MVNVSNTAGSTGLSEAGFLGRWPIAARLADAEADRQLPVTAGFLPPKYARSRDRGALLAKLD